MTAVDIRTEAEDAAIVCDVLTRARALIETPERWTRGTFARDEDGLPVLMISPEATRFCLLGAVRRAATKVNVMSKVKIGVSPISMLVSDELRATISEAYEIEAVSDWNDKSFRTHGQVLWAIDKTIERLNK